MNNDSPDHDKRSRHSHGRRGRRLGRMGFIITCLLAIGVLAGAGWGTAHLMQQSKGSMADMAGMSGMAGMNMSGMNMAGMSGMSGMAGMSSKGSEQKMGKFAGDITVDPAIVQNIGIQTTPAKQGPVIQHVRAVGEIEYDQTRLYDVNTKVDGWITKLYVDSVGEVVHQGDPLFVLDSPELYSAKQQYLISRRAGAGSEGAGGHVSRDMTDGLLAAAKAKLEYLGLSDAQIKELAKRGQATRLTTFYSPYTGVVIKKGVVQGSHITPGTQAYRIADLSKVWVIASVYESQLAQAHAGQAATMKLTYLPGKVFTGKVQYVYPYLNVASHEAKLRLVFNNPTGELKPGMFAQVTPTDHVTKPATLVPRRAVVDTGDQKLVFVAAGDGHFQPKQVVTGPTTADGWIAIKKGVKPGENVVTSGEFLLGSEASVHAVTARMTSGKSGSTSPKSSTSDMNKMNMSGKDTSDMNMGGMNMNGMNMGGMKMGGK